MMPCLQPHWGSLHWQQPYKPLGFQWPGLHDHQMTTAPTMIEILQLTTRNYPTASVDVAVGLSPHPTLPEYAHAGEVEDSTKSGPENCLLLGE